MISLPLIIFLKKIAAAFPYDWVKVSYLGLHVRHQTSCRPMNLRRFAANSKVSQPHINYHLYADDCDLVTFTLDGMQILVKRDSGYCRAFELSINLVSCSSYTRKFICGVSYLG